MSSRFGWQIVVREMRLWRALVAFAKTRSLRIVLGDVKSLGSAALGMLAVVGLAVAVPLWLLGVPHELDNKGLVAHKRLTDVMLNGDWILGEFRSCDAVAWNVAAPRVDELECIVGEPRLNEVSRHSFAVRYWGRIERKDIFTGPFPSGYHQEKWSWRCQRQSERLVCWALN